MYLRSPLRTFARTPLRACLRALSSRARPSWGYMRRLVGRNRMASNAGVRNDVRNRAHQDVCNGVYKLLNISATALARMACQECVFICLLFVSPACCFSVFLLSVCLLSVLVLFVLKGGGAHFRPVDTTCLPFSCHILSVLLGCIFSIFLWMLATF